ncbi:MAG TPA: glycosyltransferase family 87 protein [Candidatus Binataceae bacterium]|nr:glycosyltransferase family 87 protein [Candidatus Binataceae bacterium]
MKSGRFSLVRPAVATILTLIAAVTTAQRLDRFAYRYDRFNFSSFYNWGDEYNRGEPVWASVRPRRKLQFTAEYFCNYTPFFVETFSPLSRLDEKTAHTVWQLTQVAVLVAALLLLARTAEPRLDWPEGVAFAAIGVTFQSVRNLLWGSQWSPVLLLLLILSWRSSRRERPYVAGFWLAAATLLKLYPGMLGGYFALRRRWREVVSSAVLFLLGVIGSGPRHWMEFWRYGTPHSFARIASPIMALDLSAILPNVYRVVADSSGHPYSASWPLVLALTIPLDLIVVAVLVFATLRDRDDGRGLVFSMWLAAAVLLSPLAWRNELILLFPAYLFSYQVAIATLDRHPRYVSAVVIGFVTACVLGEFSRKWSRVEPAILFPLILFAACAVLLGRHAESRELGVETMKELKRASQGR